jgi:outer membrane receptor protein involved in Fe transport
MSFKKTAVASAVAAALAVPLALPSHAQQPEAGLEEIVVSARRREESLQSVPLAITAFSGESLEARGIDMVGSMNAMAPNLSVQGGQGREIESSAAFRVRGVPGVAVYVDGIDQTSAIGLFTMGVVEVDRIEVLRGPQGTLFGNSALGGAVQYVTRRPAEEFGGRVQVRAGTFNRRDVQATVDLPFGEVFRTKFTMADMNADGFMQSVDSGNSYGDINDQFYRADLEFTIGDNVTLRYAYDKSSQDRKGGARATWEVGPKSIFTLPNGVVFNTNPHAQAYENAFGILFDDRNVVSGFPGGVVGEYETRVAHDTNGLQLDLDRQTFDAQWDFSEDMQFHAIIGRREQDRRLMVDFDSDSRVFFADRQDNDEIIEDSYELQLLGQHGDRDQFNWVFGAYASDRSAKSRVPTFGGTPFICDLPAFAAATVRGVTDANRAECFNNRLRALNLQNTITNATPQMTAAQIATLWAQATALNPNYRGVTPAVFSNAMAGPSTDLLNIGYDETAAFFADLSWDVTDKLTLGFGARQQEDEHIGTDQIRHLTSTTTNIREPFPWDNQEYTLRDPFGHTAINQRVGASKYDKTTARLSAQYQFTDELMGYVTLSNGYGPGGVSTVPANILVVNAAGVATAGLLRDIYNNNRPQLDLPYQLTRGEQTVDNYEIGIKADWLDGRFRTNLTAFQTDWANMTGSTYVATIWWDLVGNDGIAETRVPCAARCDRTRTWEVNYFPNLLTAAVLEAEASGVEAELTWAGSDDYQIGFNFGLLDTGFIELGQAGEGTVPAYNQGDKFAGAPDMTANLWGQYDWSLSNSRSLSARFDYTWTDDYTTFAGGPLQRTQEAFGLLNARLVYDSGNEWQFVVAGTNLTDEYYSPAFFYTVSQQLWDGTVGRPREVYFGLNFSFD